MVDKVSKCFPKRSDFCIEMSLRGFRVTVMLGSEVVHAWITIIKLSALETRHKAKGHHRGREVRGRVRVVVGDVHTLYTRSLQMVFCVSAHGNTVAIYSTPIWAAAGN